MTTPAPTGIDGTLEAWRRIGLHDEVLSATRRNVFGIDIIIEARSLRAEDGENPEYDRALVELTTYVIGLNMSDHGHAMRELILR